MIAELTQQTWDSKAKRYVDTPRSNQQSPARTTVTVLDTKPGNGRTKFQRPAARRSGSSGNASGNAQRRRTPSRPRM